MFVRFTLFTVIALLLTVRAPAQTAKPVPSPDPPPSRLPQLHSDPEQNSSLPDEMRVRMLIAREENDYKKFVESVDKLNGLSAELAGSFQKQRRLSSNDMKKLGSIEKLARQVLSHAGGEGVDDRDLKPATLGEAIDRMTAAAAQIKKDVTAESRFVVSATVIANSNVVINLSRFIRHTQ